ncbi:hypothetical protein IAU60_001906 [Kwoniella sp. DSM 27419]
MLSRSLTLLLAAGRALAQTQQQIQNCGTSIILTTYEASPSWSTDDTTHFFNTTFTFDSVACTQPSSIPITRLVLSNLNEGTSYACPKPSIFSTSGGLHTQCSQSLGTIATAAKNGDDQWALILSFGVRPTLYTIENDFTVEYTDPAPPAGPSAQRRKKRELREDAIYCEKGWSYCPISKHSYECFDSANNLNCECLYPSATADLASVWGLPV